MLTVASLIGITLSAVIVDDDKILFETSNGKKYKLLHYQDCCESVTIESIVGDLADLIGEPLLIAEESTGETPNDVHFEHTPESYTWTFYKFATRKGYVDIRWLGQSNGYYSESVEFIEVTD